MIKVKRTAWKGPAPVVSSRVGATYFREEDEEGSVWFLAVDGAGQVLERALVEPGPKPRAKLEAAAKQRTKQKSIQESRALRLSALREKRRQKKVLTPKEKQELLDLLAGV
ncbi:MAG TPA: hypothetical protein VFC90_13740 [Planctomycetota bacterium]|nr:hypothetical protein [Planctomycetota bacterium]